jgi:hypothetical protein
MSTPKKRRVVDTAPDLDTETGELVAPDPDLPAVDAVTGEAEHLLADTERHVLREADVAADEEVHDSDAHPTSSAEQRLYEQRKAPPKKLHRKAKLALAKSGRGYVEIVDQASIDEAKARFEASGKAIKQGRRAGFPKPQPFLIDWRDPDPEFPPLPGHDDGDDEEPDLHGPGIPLNWQQLEANRAAKRPPRTSSGGQVQPGRERNVSGRKRETRLNEILDIVTRKDIAPLIGQLATARRISHNQAAEVFVEVLFALEDLGWERLNVLWALRILFKHFGPEVALEAAERLISETRPVRAKGPAKGRGRRKLTVVADPPARTIEPWENLNDLLRRAADDAVLEDWDDIREGHDEEPLEDDGDYLPAAAVSNIHREDD